MMRRGLISSWRCGLVAALLVVLPLLLAHGPAMPPLGDAKRTACARTPNLGLGVSDFDLSFAQREAVKVTALACASTTAASPGTPFELRIERSSTGAEIDVAGGPNGGNLTCTGRDADLVWGDVSADADGSLTAGARMRADVIGIPSGPATDTLMICAAFGGP